MSGKLPFHAIERKIKRMGQIRPLPSHSTYQRDIDNVGARGTSILTACRNASQAAQFSPSNALLVNQFIEVPAS